MMISLEIVNTPLDDSSSGIVDLSWSNLRHISCTSKLKLSPFELNESEGKLLHRTMEIIEIMVQHLKIKVGHC